MKAASQGAFQEKSGLRRFLISCCYFRLTEKSRNKKGLRAYPQGERRTGAGNYQGEEAQEACCLENRKPQGARLQWESGAGAYPLGLLRLHSFELQEASKGQGDLTGHHIHHTSCWATDENVHLALTVTKSEGQPLA